MVVVISAKGFVCFENSLENDQPTKTLCDNNKRSFWTFLFSKKNVTFIPKKEDQNKNKNKGIIPSSPSPPQSQTSPQYSSSSSESPLVQTTPIDNHIAKFSLEEVFGVTFCYRIANLSIFLFLLLSLLSLREVGWGGGRGGGRE